MTSATNGEVRTLEERLAEGCRRAGLNAEVVDRAGGVKVSFPGAHSRLTETVTCVPDRRAKLTWAWSWGDPICPATDIADAVKAITHVVTPPDHP
jgi:hypothetical protein